MEEKPYKYTALMDNGYIVQSNNLEDFDIQNIVSFEITERMTAEEVIKRFGRDYPLPKDFPMNNHPEVSWEKEFDEMSDDSDPAATVVFWSKEQKEVMRSFISSLLSQSRKEVVEDMLKHLLSPNGYDNERGRRVRIFIMDYAKSKGISLNDSTK